MISKNAVGVVGPLLPHRRHVVQTITDDHVVRRSKDLVRNAHAFPEHRLHRTELVTVPDHAFDILVVHVHERMHG